MKKPVKMLCLVTQEELDYGDKIIAALDLKPGESALDRLPQLMAAVVAVKKKKPKS